MIFRESIRSRFGLIGSLFLCYKTRAEAEKTLCEYNDSPYDLSSKVMTFKELYEKWSEAYFPTLSGESTIRTITSAYKYCEGLNNMRLKDIGEGQLKDCLTTGYVIEDRGKDKGKKGMLLITRNAE